MRSHSTQKLVLTAVFTALICIVTFTVKFPVPGTGGGYVNAGDGVIYAAAITMGGPLAAIAAGLGSALSDLLGGYVLYAPATLIIKAAMALVVGLAHGRQRNWLLWLGLMVAGSLVMTVGYFAYDFSFYSLLSPSDVGASRWSYALANLPYNLIQAVGGVIIGMVLSAVVDKVIPSQWQDILR